MITPLFFLSCPPFICPSLRNLSLPPSLPSLSLLSCQKHKWSQSLNDDAEVTNDSIIATNPIDDSEATNDSTIATGPIDAAEVTNDSTVATGLIEDVEATNDSTIATSLNDDAEGH